TAAEEAGAEAIDVERFAALESELRVSESNGGRNLVDLDVRRTERRPEVVSITAEPSSDLAGRSEMPVHRRAIEPGGRRRDRDQAQPALHGQEQRRRPAHGRGESVARTDRQV